METIKKYWWVFLILFILILYYYFVYLPNEKIKEDERKKKEAEYKKDNPNCKELSNVEYLALKTQYRNEVNKANRDKWELNHNDTDVWIFYNAYKDEAQKNGFSASFLFDYNGVMIYGAWVEAQRRMLLEGYCEKLI